MCVTVKWWSICSSAFQQQSADVVVLCHRQENYAKEAIAAVLSEWLRTPETLPAILRQAVQMGLFSSQQLVRFCAMDNRPTVTRTVQRSLPTSVRAGNVF